MFEENTKQINKLIANMFFASSMIIVLMTIFSVIGIFEFGKKYTLIVLILGLFVTASPRILMNHIPAGIFKYYMVICGSIFIGILGMSPRIGIYISYALIPAFSCLYFEPKFVLKTGIFSYLVMMVSLYFGSAYMDEVLYLGRSRSYIFMAYSAGFTIEFLIIISVLYYLVDRAKKMMLERYSAEEQNKIKSQFLSSMSHEIRTPMNAIIGMSDVALKMEMEDSLRNYISVIHSSANGLLTIINDILDISKIEAGKLSIIEEEYETKSLIKDMRAIIDARSTGSVPIYYYIEKDLPETLKGDAGRIKQVMLNYASNAIKYTDSGRIDVSVRWEQGQEGFIHLIYNVKDTGQGIHKEDMGKLFTMYGQLNEKLNHGKEGTGIGLALSKSFVEQMGGSVSVESEYGVGSTFSFSIPQKVVVKSEIAREEETEQNLKELTFTAKEAQILLVDDNFINREVVTAMLEPLKMKIEEAINGKEAVEMAMHKKYDLILMDSHMPVMNGEEATKRIREEESKKKEHVPILALTADAITGVREHLLECGMDDYIEKPIDMKQLYRLMKRYLPEDKIEREE